MEGLREGVLTRPTAVRRHDLPPAVAGRIHTDAAADEDTDAARNSISSRSVTEAGAVGIDGMVGSDGYCYCFLYTHLLDYLFRIHSNTVDPTNPTI